jgi:uncharacterized protein
METGQELAISSDELKSFCRTHHIRKLSFFGSFTRDDFSPQSDIDVLVEFESEFTPGLDFFMIEAELSRLLGRKADLNTINFLSPIIRKHALTEAMVAYERT